MRGRRSIRAVAAFLIAMALVVSGCGKRATRVAQGNKDQVLHVGNYAEPVDLDPHVVSALPEYHLMKALFEGLTTADPKDLRPVPGVAERWDHMNPEERERFRQRIRERCGFDPSAGESKAP